MKHVLVLLGCLSAASVQAASVTLVETNGVTLAKVTIRTSPASTVRTLVALPPKDKWDGRLWFYGNGGPAGGLDANGVLAQAACGRIGVHTDMGTHNPPEKLHHETIVDFGHRATHLSLLEAKRLARERYGRNPDYCYFEGQSTGGGQGIHAALRYPEDFDGIMSGVPANVRMPLHVYFWWARRELRKDGKPVFSNDELKAVQSAAKEVLGAKDPEWCRGKFLLDITWTQERAEAVLKRAAEMMPTLQDADKQARLQRLLKGPELGGKPVHTGLPFGSLLTNFEGLQFVLRWYVGKHADLDAVDETTIRRWVAAYSPHLDATSPDLDGFRARGGKLIVYAGLEDPIVPCPPIVDWYRSVVDRLGSQTEADAFMRFYLLPGRAHGGGSGIVDLNGRNEALIRWVEKGVAPETLEGRLNGGGTHPIEPLRFGAHRAAAELVSPDGRVRASLALRDGFPIVALSRDGKSLGSMSVGPEYAERGYGKYRIVRISEAKAVRQTWKPVWGFRAEYPENYVERIVALALPGQDEVALTLTLRTYDEGFAARYEMPLETYSLDEIRRDRMDFSFPDGTVAWPIRETEGTYPEEPIPIARLAPDAAWRMPFTLRTKDGLYASILEAKTVKWPRSFLKADGRGGLRSTFAVGTKTGREYAVSPWRVVLMAPSAGGLVERAYLVENLNDPCAVADAAEWIRPGLTTSDCGALDNASLLAFARRLRALGVRYLQIDWGWYGTERPWTDAERAGYRLKRPDLKDAEWIENTYSDPRTAARGYVPYHPFWQRLINYGRKNVDLDIPALVRDLKAMDMGLCLYLHGLVLEAHDMEELFALYERWGVAGLKPGFVSWGSQAATDYLRRMAACAAKHHLWLDIHDAQIPDGFERTWPNVMITEGGGGEEGHHPVRQDVALPFARCLAGPFDYTPRFFDPLRSRAHAAAMLLVYPGPTAVLRWSEDVRAGGELPPDAHAVFAFARSLPMTYDETVVPVGEIAKSIVVARRKGTTWYVGGLAGTRAQAVDFALGFLTRDRPYALRLVRDDGTVETRTVTADDKLSVSMVSGGGFVATLSLRLAAGKAQ